MIVKHGADHLILSDGVTQHTVKHADFRWYEPDTHEHDGFLGVHPDHDFSDCPQQPTQGINDWHDHPLFGPIPYTVYPIRAYLQAPYGPENALVTVPINGDVQAQRLHWLHRTAKERAEMRAVLRALGAWRLTDDGEIP